MTIVGVIVFFAGWIYAISSFGFFLGLGLGWLPAIVIAQIIDTAVIAMFGLTVIIFRKRDQNGKDY